MKKKILTATALLFVVLTISAQNSAGKSSLELSVGASIPFSKYASGETKRHNEGYAKTGEAITLSYFHPTAGKVGWMAMLIGQRNPLNTASLENKYSNSPSYSYTGFFGTGTYPFPNPPPAPPEIYYRDWNFDKDAWYSASLMVGAYTNVPIKKDGKLIMTMKAGIGAAYVASPQYRGTTYTDTSVILILQESNHAFGFSYTLSPGLMYNIKAGTSITFNINYFGTAGMNFNDMKSMGRSAEDGAPTGSVSEWRFMSDVKQSVQTINLLLGIRFDL